jgi:catechol 2,3-dioxygenase-like lactoylglutathione lyase family enzyme
MEKPIVTGVHHVGIGVRNIEASRQFYKDVLKCTQVTADFGISHNAMPDFFRTSPHVFNGWMYQQEEDGIVIECIQRLEPSPRPIHKQIRFGDIGVNKLTIEVANVKKFCEEYKDKIRFLCEPKETEIPGWGDYRFVFGTDPDGNLIEFISSSRIKANGMLGRIRSLGISVTELERSVAFYQKYADFDTVVIAPHESFSGLLGEVSGSGDTRVRSCVLANSNGLHMLELYEVSKPRGRSMPFHVLWGDYGYLEGCYLCNDILGLTKHLLKEDLEFISYPAVIEVNEPGVQIAAWFIYVRDPDGIPVELLELPTAGDE